MSLLNSTFVKAYLAKVYYRPGFVWEDGVACGTVAPNVSKWL
jgi:hypothetical protein